MIAYQDKRELIPQDKYLFSVTQIQEFFINPNEFFRKVVMQEKIDFHNNQTILGTLIHYAISQMYERKEVSKQEINEYINSIPAEFEIDKHWIIEKYEAMVHQVLANVKGISLDYPTEWEKSYTMKLTDNVYIGGTIDVRYDNLLLDFKTSSKLTLKKDDELPQKYIDQLYTYSYILHKHGVAIDKCGIVYFTIPEIGRISLVTGKRMKDYPMQFFIKEFYLQQEHMDMIEKRLKLIAENIEYVLEHKDSLYLFARDYDMKDTK